MEKNIKNSIKGTTLYFYYLTNPENKFLQALMDKTIIIDDKISASYKHTKHEKTLDFILNMCYEIIMENNQLDIFYDIVPEMTYNELTMLGKIAVEEYNKEIIELLHRNGLNYNFFIMLPERHIAYHGYTKHGLDIIHFMTNIGINLDIVEGFDGHAINNGNKEFLEYLIENQKQLDNIFVDCLFMCDDVKLILDLFVDKIDISNNKDDILSRVCRESLDTILLLPAYGIELDYNNILRQTCANYNFEVIEYCLQNGMQVDKIILQSLFRDAYKNPSLPEMINLFIKYNVDFSLLSFDEPTDYELLAILENNGLDKDAVLWNLLRHI